MKRQSQPVPRKLRAETRKWYQLVVEGYQLEAHHLKQLQGIAEQWDTYRDAQEAVQKFGVVYSDRFGQPKERPEVGTARDALTLFFRGLREMNLDADPPSEPRLPRLAGTGS